MGFWTKKETRRQVRPGLEALEGRAVPAIFHATTVAELEADVAAVNNTSGPNTILIAPGEYQLPGELQIQNAGDLTILGQDTAKLKGPVDIVAAVGSRNLEVDGGSVTISSVTLSGGTAATQGGVIDSQNATLTLVKTYVSGGVAGQEGGGIYAQGGTLNINTCTVTNNAASGGVSAFGGGIAASNATVNMTRTTVSHNTAYGSAPGLEGTANATGGGIYTQGGVLNLLLCALDANQSTATSGTSATALGGGIGTSNTTVFLNGTSVENSLLVALSPQVNTTLGSAFFATNGGSLTIANGTLTGNTPGSLTGSTTNNTNEIYHPGTTVVLKNSTVETQKIEGSETLAAQGITTSG